MRDGDFNNRYFHFFMKMKNMKKFSGSFESSKEVVNYVKDVKEICKQFSEYVFSIPRLEGIDFRNFSLDDNFFFWKSHFRRMRLRLRFGIAIFVKVPSPEISISYSLKIFWSFLKEDIICVAKDFHSKSRLNKSISSSFKTHPKGPKSSKA